MHSDSANKIVVSIGQDGTVKAWQFKNRRLKLSLQLKQSVLVSAFHSGTSLLAIADHEHSIQVLDMTVGKVVRMFKGIALGLILSVVVVKRRLRA